MTHKLYLEDAYRREFDAVVVASDGGWWALSDTLFHAGGGGQPADRGQLAVGDQRYDVRGVREDEAQRVWHDIGHDVAADTAVHGTIDWAQRHGVMRAHALMHIVNTVALRDYEGVITGVQLGPERSRIDFRLPRFAREDLPRFERAVNDVITQNLAVTSSVIDEAEYRRRPELIRTLNVTPPIVDGKVRIVEIAGFDAQACGGTHVHTTGEIGAVRITKFDNKGKDNKRFYWEFTSAGGSGA